MGSILDQIQNWANQNISYSQIDCSHLVNQMLNDAGYGTKYECVAQFDVFDTVTDPNTIQPGDIVLWNGHVDVVTSYNPLTRDFAQPACVRIVNGK